MKNIYIALTTINILRVLSVRTLDMLNVNNKKNDIAENQQKERNSQKKEERK
jgi:hypothetical protein